MKYSPVYWMALLLLSSQGLAAGESCPFESIPTGAGDFTSRLEKVAQDACGSLQLDEHTYESVDKLQKKAFNTCCKHAASFIRDKKHADAGSVAKNLQTEIDLSIKLCDRIWDHELSYQRDLCWNNTVRAMGDERITRLEEKCHHKENKVESKLEEARPDATGLFGLPPRLDEGEIMDRGEEAHGDCVHKELGKLKKSLDNDSAGSDPSANSEMQSSKKGSETQGSAPVPVVDPARSGF